jgi:hypothetical protein
MTRVRTVLTAILLTSTATAAVAETITVSPGQSIEAAIKQAQSGDTVAVKAGVYRESIYAHASGVKVVSVDGRGAAHIVSSGTGIFLQGGSGTEIRGFRVTAGPNGNGIQVGGAASGGVIRNYAEGYVVADNIIHDAGLDGIKVHQAKGFTFTGNVIENAGTGNKGNADGGIDFVAVSDSKLEGNTIIKTGGNSCVMLKGGSARNTITGNSFGGCKDAIHVGGFTGPRPAGFKEAHDNRITGNNLCAGDMAFRLFDGEAARRDNVTSGNTINAGCASATEGDDGGRVNEDNTDDSYDNGFESGGGDGGDDGDEYGGTTATLASSSGDFMCSGSFASLAVAAVDGVISMLGGGRASQLAQGLQIKEAVVANFCSAQMNDKLADQLAEQRRMNARIGANAARIVRQIERGAREAIGSVDEDLYGTDADAVLHDRYQAGMPDDWSFAGAAGHSRNVREQTDRASREAAITSAASHHAVGEALEASDEALNLSQGADGVTKATQAQTQMMRAQIGVMAAQHATMTANETAKLRIEEERRSSEVIADQKTTRFWARNEATAAPVRRAVFE